MTSLLLVIPLGLLCYSIWRSTRQPIFLICIPFFQVMGTGIFFDKINVFWMPGRFSKPLIILIWMFVLWLIFHLLNQKLKSNQSIPIPLFPLEYFILLIFGLWAFNFVYNLVIYQFDEKVFQEGINLLSMLLGYFLLRDIFVRSSIKDVDDFLKFINFVNIIALGIFIADNSLALQLLPQSYSESFYQNILVKRTFLPTPLFWFGIAYAFSATKWKIREIIQIAFSFVAILVSGTRSLLLITSILFVVSLILQFSKKNQRINLGKKLLTFSIMGVLLLGIVTTLFQAHLNYFTERIGEYGISVSANQGSTFDVRIFDIQNTINIIQKTNSITGVGFIGQATGYWLGNVYVWFADTDWAAILWRYGFLGLVLFCILYFTSMFESLQNYLVSNNEKASYWLMPFFLVLAIVLFSFFSWTTFNANQFYVLSFLPFVLVLVGHLKYSPPKTQKRIYGHS